MQESIRKIVRWTLGAVNQEGIDCLKQSIYHFDLLYPEFEKKICYNDIDDTCLAMLQQKYPNIELIDQKQHLKSIKIPPIKNHSCWKLYPPRLDLNSYEIFIDNDLILFNKLEEIDELLNSQKPFITESTKDNVYGHYNRVVPFHLRINAGFFGIPPQFDLSQKIHQKLLAQWKYYLDEQGLMAYIFSREKFNLVKQEKIPVLLQKTGYRVGTHGMHFVGLNRGFKEYWNSYLLSSTI